MKKTTLLAAAVALSMGASVFAGTPGTEQAATTAAKAPVAAENTNAAGLTANANTATKAAPVTNKVMHKKGGKKKKSK